MNKVYKVIWSEVRKCYVVVAEIAKNHGKNNTKSIVSQLAARWIAPLVLAGILLQPVSGFASTITDKNGNNLIRRGNVQNLYVQTMLDDNNIGLNRFGEYKISNGDIANMHFNKENEANYANNLVNLVNSKIDIQGTVNAVKNGKIDGNLYFISPDGMTVGPTGVINAGRVGVFIPDTIYWDAMWKEDVNVENNFADFENFGRRDTNGKYNDTGLVFAKGKTIEIEGQINTRNGIVLGARDIVVQQGAVLKRSADPTDVNFNVLVNIKNADGTEINAGLGNDLNAVVDGSTGDIILRTESAHSFVNGITQIETLESVLKTEVQSSVTMSGTIVTDGAVDISAEAETSFTNLAYAGTSLLSDIGANFLNGIGIAMTASWLDKTNTAKVALTETGSIKAVGNVTLQTDAAMDLRLKAAVVNKKEPNTTTAIPVVATGVIKLGNQAVTDVRGSLESDGNIRLAANADTVANLSAHAVQNTEDNDPANSIYTGVAVLNGNGLAEVNVAGGNAIAAGGVFSASARGTNQTAVLATAKGKHETFTSTAVAVSDYDSAANVNLGRSVTANSVTGEAVNDVKSLAILADNSNGDGAETYVEFEVKGGKGMAANIAGTLKNKLGITGLQNGGVLLPVENFLDAAKDYVTAGAGIAVVDHSNTANLTVAQGVELKAVGSAVDNRDVTLSSETVMSTLNQIVTGQSNQKADEDGGSTVTVAAGVLVSNIENSAATEVLGGTGSALTSDNGSVTVTANTETNTDHVITTLHRSGEGLIVEDLETRVNNVIHNLENVEKDAEKLKKLKEDFQRAWGQMQGIQDGHVSSFFNALMYNSLTNFVFTEWRDYYKIGGSFKAAVDSLLDYVSPAAYTSHYVRSYSVNRNQGGDTNMDLAASVNVGSLAGKAVVSLGEVVAVNAGKDITVDAKSVSDLASITGTGGEFLSYSETNGNGVGASIAVQQFTSDAIVLTGKNVVLNAINGTAETDGSNNNVPKSGTVSINADSDATELALIFSAGKSGANDFSGSFNIQTGGSNSLVLVDDEAKITAVNGVTVGSNNDYVMNNIVGGLAIGGSGSNVTVGAGLALNQLDVNSMAVLADNGKGASIVATDTDTEAFKNKSAEEQNEIKAENTVIAARKLAAERANVKKMDTSFAMTGHDLTAALGNKTEGTKGFVTGRNISVTAQNDGILNAIALEGADVSENHSVFDSINKTTSIAENAKEQSRAAIKNVADWPGARLTSLFTKSGREGFKTETSLSFANYNPVNENGQNANASFNAEAAASFAWNNLDTQTAAIADNMTLNLRKQNSSEADGTLVTSATDELFTGAWAGSGSVMWFTGAAQGPNNANKGALGTAVAVNKLDQKINSLIIDSDITQAGSVLNKAIKNGSEVAAGLGIAVVNETGGAAASGSAAFGLSLNIVDNDIHVIMIDSSATYEKDDVSYTGGTNLENRAHDGDIQVAGGVNMSWLSNGGSGIAAGITAAASDLENDIQSGIQGGIYSGIGNLSVKADNALTQVNAGVGVGVAQSGGSFSVGGAGTLALNELENTSRAFIADTDRLTAAGSVTVMAKDAPSSSEEANPYKEYLAAREVDSTGLSYLGESARDAVGTGAGNTIVNVAIDVAESKGVSAGAAVSVNQVTNRISADITGNEQIKAATVNGEADVHSNIVSLATGASVSESSFGGAASVSWNDLQQDNIVSVTGNRDSEEPASGGILADSVTGTAQNTSHIVNVTGEFAGGQNSVGLSVAVNRMEDISGIYFAKNRIGARNASVGTAVSLNADNDASALAIGVGVDANYKENSTAAAYGNFVANRGHNDTIAVIGEDKDGNKASGADRDRIDNAASVEVRATDETQRTTVAGSAQLAVQGVKAALGAGMALTGSDAGTESGDGRETLRAEIINTDITTVKKNGTDAAVTVSSADKSKATTAIVGVGITTKSTVAAQGLGADAKIYKNNTAGLNDTTIDATGGSKTALVSVKAETSSEVNTGAAALQLAGPDTFLAGVVAVGVNRITDNTVAGVTYTNKPDAASLNVGNLDISAASNGEITSVAMGASVAVKGTAAVGGSGSHNYIDNSAAAKIENANIDSAGNVGVVAQSDEAITNYAGVIDVAAYGQGVSAALGVTGSNNKISGNTEALIRNSKVVAESKKDEAGNYIFDAIKTKSELKTDDAYLIDGAVTSNTWSAGKLQKGREEEEKTGVVVDASATHAIASVLANGGVAVGSGDSGAGASLAGVINLNDLGGSTTAKVEDSQLNEEAADKRSHVTVHAADYTNVAELSGAAAVGIGEKAGIAAGFTGTTNEISRVTEAGVSMASAGWKNGTDPNTSGTDVRNYDIYAQDFVVTADAKQAMSAFNVTGAIAGSSGVAFETGDNVNTNRMKSSTVAAVTNTAVDYKKDAMVKASHGDAIYNLNVDVGAAIAPSQKGVAGSLNVGVGVVQESSVVTASVEHSKLQNSNTASDPKSSLSVGAANTTTLETRLVSVGVAAGAFSGGIASSIAVNNISTKVTGNIVDSVLAADTVDVHTTNALAVHDAVGTGAGALEVGVGVGVDVTTVNDSVSTIVDNSTVKAADTLSINTETQRETDSTVAGVGIGALSVAVNVLSVTVNDSIVNLEDVNDEEAGSSFSHSSMLDEAVKEVNNTTGRVLADKVAGMTADEKQKMQEKSETGADYGDNVSGAGAHTYVRGNSALEAVNGALTVNNTERNDADLNGGSGSLGLLAVNVADVVYHRNEENHIAVADSTVKGGSIALTTTQGNVTDNKTDAIRARTVQAQAGIAGIGVGYAGITAKGSTGVSVNHAVLTAADGDLTLKSADTVQSRSNMIGVSAALLAVPVSVAHNTNKTDQYITVQGGSTLSAARRDAAQSAAVNLQTERTGRVASKTVGVGAGGVAIAVNSATSRDESVSRVAVSDSGNTFRADSIALEAVNAPSLKAEAGGTDAALIGVSVMQSNAIAKSQAGVTVADDNRLLGDDVLARAVIGKEGTDMTHAETHGINVTVVGVNPDKAKAVTETTAGVTVGREAYKTEKKEKVKNEQGAEEERTVQGSYTSLALISQNNASRRAILGNTTVGLAVSIGAGDAKAEGDDRSIVEAKGGDGDGAVKLQNLKINAGGKNGAQGLADGDSGGIIAVGAEATITLKTKTENTASLSGAWDVTDNADIGSFQQVTSKGSSKTGAGGVLSVTWANSDNNVEMDTRTELKEGAKLTAGHSYMLAENKVITGAYDGEHWSNHMNIGGVIQIAPDVTSDEVITTKTNVYIGKNAKVTTKKGQVYEAYADLDITNKVEGKSGGVGENMWVYSDNTVKSTNKITVDEGAELDQDGEYENGSDLILSSSDKIKMDVAAEAYTGGLEGVLVSKAISRVTRNNGVEVNGKLNSTHDINLYAGANVDGSDAELKITGLSESHNNTLLSFYTSPKLQLDLKNNQQVKVGKSGDATAIRHINATAANGSESFRKEVVKVVNLLAGKDTSVKTVSNAPGVSDIDESNDNWVNVEGRLKTGIQNNVKIDITGVLLPTVVESYKDDNNQTVEVVHHLTPVNENLPKFNVEVINNSGTNPDTIVKKEDIKSGDMDYATQLGNRLAILETLISEYSNGNKDNTDTAAYLGYVQERQRILEEMEKRHLFTEEDDGKGGTVKVYINKGFTISYVEIPEIIVSGGNIVVQSENLYGKGKLDANGAPRIEINNLSDAYLKLDGLRVGESGGEIRFRGQSISSGDAGKEQINDLNSDKGKKAEFTSLYSDSSSEVSTISVLNNNEGIGTELPVQDQNGKSVTYVSIPDVAVLGNITNNFGDVKIENKQGNITIGSGSAGKGANINGRAVQLIATTGSISQDYIDGIVNIGGRPQDMNYEEVKVLIDRANISGDKKIITTDMTPAKTNIEKAETGRIAGDSVYLAAADINVNGLIQSGYGKFEVVIPEKDENGNDILSDENIQKLKNNGSEVTIQGRTMYKLNDGNKAVYDESTGAFKYVVQVYYDPTTKGLFVEDIDTKGGKIYLTGRISSTEQIVKQQDGTEKVGNGRILAVDGGAEIAITNNTKADLTTGKILNNDVEGTITITDLAKDTWTEYTRSQTTVISDYSKQYLVKPNEAEYLKTIGAAIGRYDKDNPTRYETKAGLRYNWTLGQEKSTTCYYEKVTKTLFWGGVDIGTDTNKLSNDEKQSNLTEEPIITDGRKLGEGTFIDTISDGYQDSNGNKLADTEFGSVLESNITSTSREVTGNWKEGGKWYALWSNPKYHTTWTTKEASTQAYTFSLKADNPIGIGFIGQKDGSITVKNANSAGGNINLNGNIQSNTKDATLTVQALGGSISQKSGTAVVTGNADLKAMNNIENIHITSMGEWRNTGEKDAAGNDIYTASDGVLLKAESMLAGNIDLEVTGGVAEGQALPGNVIIRSLKSQSQILSGQPGGVNLKAEGNINQEGTGVAVQARTIRLTSENGAIGSDGEALLIDSSAEAFGKKENSAGLNATAKNNINIEEAEGSMRVGLVVSQDGDVRLGAPDGRLLDALPLTDDGDNVDENDLIYHWIDAGLIAGTPDYEGAYIRGLKQDAANYKARVEEQYELFTRGEANKQIKDMFTKKDGTAYASAADYLAADEKYKALQDAYDPEKVQFAWTKEQLLYAIRNAVVNKESGVSAETQSKVANVQGKNVTLAAKGVGMNTNQPTVINVSDLSGGSSESVKMLKQLANADAADVTMKDANGNTLVSIVEKETQPDGGIIEKQAWIAYDKAGNIVETDGVIDTFVINNMSPLGVYATGRVDVTASGDNVFIAGRSNDQAGFAPVNVGKITASDQKDVRLYTQEGIYNAVATDDEAMQGNILSHNLIAYGGTKDIGAKGNPLLVNLSGDLLGAYADGNVYIKNVLSDDRLRLGSVFAKDTIYLESAKGFDMTTDSDYQLAYLNAEKQLELKTDKAQGGIGEADNPIRILNNDGIISLTGKDGYVKGVNGTRGDDAVMKLGRVEMTDIFVAASEGNLEAGVTSPAEKDEDGDVVRPEVTGEVKAGSNVKLEAVKDLTLVGPATAGTVSKDDTGKYTGGGQIDLFSAKGAIVQNANGGLVAGSVTATSGKGVVLTDANNTFREFTAYGVNTEVTDAQGNKVTEKAIDGSVNVRTHAGSMLTAGITGTVVYGDVALTNLDGGGLTVDTDIVTKKGNHGEAGNITFSQQGDILMSQNANLQAGGSVFAESTDGTISLLGKVEAARDIDLKTGSGKIRLFGDVHAGNDILAVTTSGDIEMDNGVAAQHDIVAISGSGNIGLMGDINAGNDVNAQTGGDGKILFNLNFLTGRHEVHAGHDVNLTVENSAIVIAGKVTTDTGDVCATARTGGMIFSGSIQAGNDIIASVTEDGVIQYSGTVNAARDIIATTAAGNINYSKQVEAGRSVMALTDKGDVTYNAGVMAGDSVLADVLDGDVTVNHDIVARQGYVTLTLADGSATVGKADGTGKIKAGNDVSIITKKGDATVKTSITSDNGGVSVSSEQGNIEVGEVPTDNAILAQKDVNLYVADGVIIVNGRTNTAEGDILVQAWDEDTDQNIVITHNGKLDSGRDLTLHTYNGSIEVTGNTTAKRDLNVIVDNEGSIEFGKDVKVHGDVNLKTANGDITMGKRTDTGATEVHTVTSLGGSIDIETGKGNISIGQNAASDPTIDAYQNVKLTTQDGTITVDGKTMTKKGDITVIARDEDDPTEQNLVITMRGELDAGTDKNPNATDVTGNLTLQTYNGDIKITDRTNATGDINAKVEHKGSIGFDVDVNTDGDLSFEVDEGDIYVGNSVTATGDISMTAVTGNINVGKDIIAGTGVTISSQNGDVMIGDTNTGNDGDVLSKTGDVYIQTGQGDVKVVKTVTAQEGSIDISTQEGTIHIGSNGRDVKTVTAKEDVSLVTEEGKIVVYGKTSTENGDITLKAANTEYIAGADGQNIIIDHDGQIDSGQDATLIAKNGDLHVTDKVWAKRNLNAITQSKGDVFLDDNLTVEDSVNMKTETGDIFADRNVKAGNRIVAATGDGDITIGTADAKYVALTSGGEDGHVNADTVLAQASGNSNGTGLEDVKLGGSYVNVNTVVNNSNGSTPLTILTLGGAADKPVKDLNIGKQNTDLSYSGGIQSASGAVIQELWADRGMLYVKGDTNLHVSKLVINEKLHVANDVVSVGVFGVPPYRDGTQVVFWNDADAKDPSGMLARWYDRLFTDPMWMYLDLFSTGEVGSRYGVLMDAQGDNRIYGDSVSVVDTMRIRTEPVPDRYGISYFDRHNLIEIGSDGFETNADSEEIIAEGN